MAKHGEGLAKEIVKAVNNGEIEEPITRKKVYDFCKLKGFDYADGTKGPILSNSEVNRTHSPSYPRCFKKIREGEYVVVSEYKNFSFEEDIQSSMNDTQEERLERIAKRNNTIPEIYIGTSAKFKRNSDVVAEVLFRANGICEECNCEAPFKRKSDGTPYLEVHHKISLSDKGEDTVENCIAVCPNCHRKLHYGQ